MALLENCFGGCFIGLMVLIVGFNSALAIAALQIAHQYGADECMVKFQGISFDYGTWLVIYGWTQISESLILLTLAGCFGVLILMHAEDIITFVSIAMGAVLGIGSLFQIAWYVVGAILFFMEVAPHCSSGLPLYKFGLTLFVIKSVIVGCGLLSANAKKESN